MSFILEALRKSEEERRRGKIPGIDTNHGTNGKKALRRPIVSILLVTVLLLNGGILLWWGKPWRDAEDVPPPVPAALAAKEAISSDSEPARQKGGTIGNPADARPLAVPDRTMAHPPSDSAVVRKRTEAKKISVDSKLPSVSPGTASGTAKFPMETTRSAPPEDDSLKSASERIYQLDQLPAHLRRDLPEIHVSLHYFTEEPSYRLIRVNNRNLREGDKLDTDLYLEEIASSSVIFRFRGTRFQMGNF